MYFTLAISAVTSEACAALLTAAQRADPRAMPIPGPARLAWRSPDERAAVLHWGATHGDTAEREAHRAASHAGTIWIGSGVLCARTGVARVDPVYVAETPGAVVVSDRASWAAAATGRLNDHDPVMVGAFLSLGYPMGAATPFRRVRAMDGGRMLRATSGRLVMAPARHQDTDTGPDGSALVGAALVDAVRPLADPAVRPAGPAGPVELSLTGGKDSRLIAAALTAAGVPFRARTHGFPSHPDVVIAGMIAERLGVEHTVTEPRPAATADAPDQGEVLGRLRSAVLVSDGMLSAFENVGRPDPVVTAGPVQAGGHGGELLRGGYAQAAWRTGTPDQPRRPARPWRAVRGRSAARAWSGMAAVELFRRLTTRRLGLLRPAAAAAYLASLAPSAAALAGGPLRALDDFYLANRAGRWSAAARQAYLIRSPLLQPFFHDRVVGAARAVPLGQRMNDQLHREVLAVLGPELLDIPLAGRPWKGEARTPPESVPPPDWRREYGLQTARFLRGYVLDAGGTGPMFDIVQRPDVERLLQPPQADPQATWALATLAALLSGDWLNARRPASVGALAAAVPRLGPPEVHHAHGQRHDRPAGSGQP